MAGNKDISYENAKAAKKDEIIRKCEKAGCGKKDLNFLLTKGRSYLMLKPKNTVTVDEFTFNLRYSNRFDTPFEDDQDADDALLDLKAINIDDGNRIVRKNERCLAMYLMLHSLQGNDGFFVLENKEEERKNSISVMEMQSAVFEKIKTSQVDELQAAYYGALLSDPSGKDELTLRHELYLKSQNDLKSVSDAFGDERMKIKYKLFNALKFGHLEMNPGRTTIKWKNGDVIVNVVPGDNAEEAFVNKCLGSDGDKLISQLNNRLSK